MLRVILCMSFLLSLWGVVTCHNGTRSHTADVSNTCPGMLHRVDYLDELWVKGVNEYNSPSNISNRAWWGVERECKVTFETTQDQGLCVEMESIEITDERITLEFFTTAYRPEKQYGKVVSSGSRWCTHKNQLTMIVRLPQGGLRYLPPLAFDFTFQIKNKSLDLIEKVYNMGSPAQCDLHYNLGVDETAIIKSDSTPPFYPLPTECKMTFTSLTTKEYGQVCVWIDRLDILPECDMKLEITGLDKDYWTDDVTYSCETNTNTTQELCSGDRMLTLKLKRGKNIKSANFDLKIASKKMLYWESAEAMKTELSALSAAKSLTVLIATLDTVIVLTAAFISIATRYPYGRLKVIGDMFGKDPAVPHHYGNEYPVAVAVTSGEADPPPF